MFRGSLSASNLTIQHYLQRIQVGLRPPCLSNRGGLSASRSVLVMTTFRDIPADILIPALAGRLSSMDGITTPEWASVVKTGVHRERPPEQENWWAVRSAEIGRAHV